MQTFDQALFDLYEANVITYEDACATPTRSTTCACRSSCTDLAAGTEHFSSSDARGVFTPTPAPLGTFARLHFFSHMSHQLHAPTNLSRRRTSLSRPGRDGLSHGGHLALAGHSVTVYNRTAAKSWHGAQDLRQPRRAQCGYAARGGHGASFVFCCVGNDDDLRSVVLGADGALPA
jgi:hypothetical protein